MVRVAAPAVFTLALVLTFVTAIGWITFGALTNDVVSGRERAWTRTPTEADRPRVWGDAVVRLEGQPRVCFDRYERYHGGKNAHWAIERYLDRSTIDVELGGVRRTIDLLDLDTPASVPLVERQREIAEPRGLTINGELRITEACIAEGDSVALDACEKLDASDVLTTCRGTSTAGWVHPPSNLHRMRIAAVRRVAWAGLLLLPLTLALAWLTSIRERGFPLARRVRMLPRIAVRRGRATLAFGAIAVVIAVVAFLLRAPLSSLAAPLATGLVLGALGWRIDALRALARELGDPPKGVAVLDATVDDDAPTARSPMRRSPVAFSNVELARVVPGKNGEAYRYVDVGSVADVGELALRGPFGRVSLVMDEATLVLDVDHEEVVPRSRIPLEVAKPLGPLGDERYRVREYVLDPGDTVTVLVESDGDGASTQTAGSAYRTDSGGFRVASGAQPIVFDGTRDAARRTIRRQAWVLEALFALTLAVAVGVAVYGVEIGALLRE